MTIARHLAIFGRVQGVFYRGWAVKNADELGLVGWVRNRHDGSVEAVVQGDEDAIESFIARARNGPTSARVESVEVHEIAMDDQLAKFVQKPTA